MLVVLLQQTVSEPVRLSNLLKDVNQSFSISNQTYNLKSGKIQEDPPSQTKLKVLRLATLYQWTKEDPLFYSPDLDAPRLSASIANLIQEHEKLITTMESSTNLYPVNFLNKWVEAASLTKEFLDRPSDLLAEKLLTEQKELVDLYEKEADQLIEKTYENEAKIVGLNIVFTPQTIKADLEKIKANAQALSREIEKREKCLAGEGECTRPALRFSKPENQKPKNSEVPDLLEPEFIYKHSRVSGPFSTQTPCFGGDEDSTFPTHYFYVREVYPAKDKQAPLPYLDIKLATDLYFYKLSLDSQIFEDRQRAKRGIKYAGIGATNPYLCPNQEYFAEIAQLNFFLKRKGLILQNAHGLPAEAVEAEREFFAESYPSWAALSRLADYYGYIYKTLIESPEPEQVRFRASPAPIDSNLKEELLERHLGIKRKLGDFDLILNWVAKFLPGFTDDFNLNKKHKLTPVEEKRKNVYNSKNFYGIVFLPFSPSFWQLRENPSYIEKTLVKNAIGPGLTYLTYRQALENYKKEEVEQWLQK